MLEKRYAIVFTILCFIVFWVTLFLELHGAIASVAVILFFLLFASAMDSYRIARRVLQYIGWLFIIGGAIGIVSPGGIPGFDITVIIIGIILVFTVTTRWIVKAEAIHEI